MKIRGLAIASAALAGLVTMSASAGISNGSFEAGMTDWAVDDLDSPFFVLDSYAGGTVDTFGWGWSNTPTDGEFSMVTGWDGDGFTSGPLITIAQDITVDAGTLEFDYRAAWDLTFGGLADRTFSVIIEEAGGGAVLDSMLFLTATQGSVNLDTGQLAGSMDLSAFAGDTVRLIFEWSVPEDFAGPAQFDLDNVRLTPTPGALAMLALAGLARRRRR